MTINLEISENGRTRFRLSTTREKLAELNRRLAGEQDFRTLFWTDPCGALAEYGVEADPAVFAKEPGGWQANHRREVAK